MSTEHFLKVPSSLSVAVSASANSDDIQITPTSPLIASPDCLSRSHSPVATSPDGKFILHYLGAAMMDSRCTYTPQMMPWIIAEILRFSESFQVVLLVSNGQVTCNSMATGKAIFDSHILDFIRIFPVITSDASSDGYGSSNIRNERATFDTNNERKYFATIIKANDIYLHCRLFTASCDEQVSEVMSTMKESTKIAVNGSVGPSVGGALRSASAPKVSELADIVPTDAITFEVLYTGKLRMSSKKAPESFIDDALAKFKSHENEKDSVSFSRRSSSQESTSDLGGSSESLQSSSTTNKGSHQNTPPILSVTLNPDLDPLGVEKSPSRSTLVPLIETTDSQTPDEDSPTDEEKHLISRLSVMNIAKKQEEENMRKIGDSYSPPPTHRLRMKHPLEDMESSQTHERTRHPSGDSFLVKSMSLPVAPMRNRALSTGHYPRGNDLDANKPDVHYNRTMILIIGRHEMRLISPDAKTSLFVKNFRDIYSSSQGIENKEYFGFICRESATTASTLQKPSGSGFVAYVFRCESASVAGDILNVLKQAYKVNHENLKKERQIQSCDHCPMVWYRKLCSDIDGFPCDERIQNCILKNINGLPDEDRTNILAKFRGAGPQTTQEQNELLMMLLRAHCESKQAKHIHDTAENRHEFLSQYLGGGTIFMKATRSITNSFDHLIKRKGKDGIGPGRELSLPQYSSQLSREICGNASEGRAPSPVTKSPGEQQQGSGDSGFASGSNEDVGFSMVVSDSPLANIHQRPRSSTVGALTGEQIRCEIRNSRRTSQGRAVSPSAQSVREPKTPTQLSGGKGHGAESSLSIPSSRSMGSKEQKQHSPMMNIFMKVGSQNKPVQETSSGKSVKRSGSWRHAIFKRVVSPNTPETPGRNVPSSYAPSTPVSSRNVPFRPRRTRAEIRELWKSAINQQIILIRMEKQNLRLKAKQQEADVKRLKLSYGELGTCDEEANDTWDMIISQAQSNPSQKCDIQLLNSAILRGIPKQKRGQVWQFFIQQRKLDGDGGASSHGHINLEIPYEQLLRQLTSQQHAILIDLGRTFPSHPYFSSPLGSGQLALFNILKAYSLLDTDVGYCQGLSFVAGLLLMHYEEDDAFNVLKYLMFTLGAREHYKPDMLGLQVKLYQLTRLIHEQDPDIHLLLYHNDVLPSLYAAPWFLTLFASQFPVGFAVRVLDLVLLHGVDVIAKFALAIIVDNKKQLMQCNGLEQVMDCFKTVVTEITSDKLDRYLRKVIESELDKQMLTYAVEYSVMNDEAFSAFLSESNSAHLPSKLHNHKSSENKLVQTEASRDISPTGESHPILGELIQRQNSEISKLKQEKSDLRKDIQTLLSCVLTMQKLAKISNKGAICPPIPPQVTDIASKYVIGGANYFSSVMENGWTNESSHTSSSSSTYSTLKSVDEYDERTVAAEESLYYGILSSRERLVKRNIGVNNARGFPEIRPTSHVIPSLDPDSDDNSDNSSHQVNFENKPDAKSSSDSTCTDDVTSTKSQSHNSNGNRITTIQM